MATPPKHVVTIACDESGAEGENVIDAAHRVFCHGSTDLTAAEAADLIAYARKVLKTQAPELKSEQLLKPKARPLVQELFAAGGPLDGRCQMNLTDKSYFLVGKVIDLLIVELAHDTGVDLYLGRQARQLAHDLFREGARALGATPWDDLLRKFNSLMRTTQRTGLKVSVDEFYEALDTLKYRAHRKKVEEVLVLLARSKPQVEDFQRLLAEPGTAAALDPLLAAVPETIRIWHEATGGPIDVIHDQQVALDPTTIAETIAVLRRPPSGFRHLVDPVDVCGITLSDSKHDPRVQVADLVAGLGRRLGTEALAGEELTIEPRDNISTSSVWADNPSWQTLTGKAAVDS